MKNLIAIICLSALVLVINACSDEDFDLNNPNVGEYVSLLKAGTYAKKVGDGLPNFSMSHIGELIKYLTDTTEISNYPANPISSKFTAPKKLNECLMWTIEGIRLNRKYVSLEPTLVDTSKDEYPRLTNKQLIQVSEKYLEWYNEYKADPSETVKKKDLLEHTSYKWN